MKDHRLLDQLGGPVHNRELRRLSRHVTRSLGVRNVGETAPSCNQPLDFCR